MKVEFGKTRKLGVIAKVWDKEGNIVRFDGDGLEWLKAQLASGKDGEYEPAPPLAEDKPAAKPATKKKTTTKKRGLLG